MSDKAQLAKKLFLDGYNCSQAVFGAYAEDFGIDFSTAMKISSGFGGGFGRMREVCGAVSGMFIVEGLLEGYDYPDKPDAKQCKTAHYARIQELAHRFKQINGSIVCREILGARASTSPIPDDRTPEYYKTRPCAKMCGDAAEVLETFLRERGIIK